VGVKVTLAGSALETKEERKKGKEKLAQFVSLKMFFQTARTEMFSSGLSFVHFPTKGLTSKEQKCCN
jgi:hypothetical protein